MFDGDYSNLSLHPSPTYGGDSDRHQTNVAEQVLGEIDETPKIVGAIVLIALGTIVALRTLGFRFAFGASGKVSAGK